MRYVLLFFVTTILFLTKTCATAANSSPPPPSPCPFPSSAAFSQAAPKPAPALQGPASARPLPEPQEAPPGATPTSKLPPQTYDQLVMVDELERLMFGHSKPTIVLENRLDSLEWAVFQQTYPTISKDNRILHLQKTLLGSISRVQAKPMSSPAPAPGELSAPFVPADNQDKQLSLDAKILANPEFQKELATAELEQFALLLINKQRLSLGLSLLAWDDVASKIAHELLADISRRKVVSHYNSNHENPDLRYTKAGGTDALQESLIACDQVRSFKPNKAVIVKLLNLLLARQDDSESLLSSHATHFGFALSYSPSQERLIGCAEIVTKHGVITVKPQLPELNIGDKIEIQGLIYKPYRFNKITIAWEGFSEESGSVEDNEAAPYFPPLDYEAFAAKAEYNREKRLRILQTAGIGIALAGGLFMPPVALAAPFLAISTGQANPRPVSEIPVRGGVKVKGAMFYHKVPINCAGKEGLYFVTVWASTNNNLYPTAISRHVIIAKKEHTPKQ